MDFGGLDDDWTSGLWAIAARVAASHYGPEPVRTRQEDELGSAMPGDEIADPEPFRGMGLSTNPSPRISPQVITEGISQGYSGELTYSNAARRPSPPTAGSHRVDRGIPALRALVRRD